MQQHVAERSLGPTEARRRPAQSQERHAEGGPEAVSPGVIGLQPLQAMADASPRMLQLSAFQEMATASPQARQLRSLQMMADGFSDRRRSSDGAADRGRAVAQLYPIVEGAKDLPTTANGWFRRFLSRGNAEPNILRVLQHLEAKAEVYESETDLVMMTRMVADILTERASGASAETSSKGPTDGPTRAPVLTPSSAKKAVEKAEGKAPKAEPLEVKKKKRSGRQKVLLDLSPSKDRRAEFRDLPASGTINPRLLCFSQSGCSFSYQTPFKDLMGRTIRTHADHVAALKSKAILPDSTPPIVITCCQIDDLWEIFSVDNRRLKVHLDAGMDIKYVKRAWHELSGTQQDHFDGKANRNLDLR